MDILTIDDVKRELRLDDDFDEEIIKEYIADATSFIITKTEFDWTAEESIHPLCKKCAKLYIKQSHYETPFSKEHDYTLGISALISDLNDVARRKRNGTGQVSS